jgi:hypothetical protein
MSIPLNGDIPLGYRIGTSDRTLGAATDGEADGFLVLNQTNNNVFVAQGGVWVDGGTFDADLLAAWYATVQGTNPPGSGYAIGMSDRTLGDPVDGEAEGFLVLNLTNNNVFLVQGGVWVDGGTFPSDLLAAWLAA